MPRTLLAMIAGEPEDDDCVRLSACRCVKKTLEFDYKTRYTCGYEIEEHSFSLSSIELKRSTPSIIVFELSTSHFN